MTRPDRSRFGFRLVASCLVLVGAALAQSPGLLVPDTKFDLAIAPGRFLERALHLWDPLGTFGQLQNQAYGYLWPMGPFFLVGDALGLPEWTVQRLWLGLVLVVAFLGTALLVRALGVRSDLACLVAGFAFALSPRMLTTLGPISIEAWPSALAPWVLLPLVLGADRMAPRRAAGLSALAVGMVGGVNAAATAAVLPLGAVWILTRTAGGRRRSLLLWWPLFTVAVTLWWLVPLFSLGVYSPPFLDFIESAGNTTFPTTLVDSLRGTSNWVPYVQVSSRAGNDLLRDPTTIVNSAVLLMLGLGGLALRRNPHRVFLVLSVGVGLFLVTMGHTGVVQGWAAEPLQRALDGALAPLRNVHKFDVVVRLPLVIGLAWAVEEAVDRWRRRTPGTSTWSETSAQRLYGALVAGTAAVAVVGASSPVLAGRLTPASATLGIPDYWQAAVQHVSEQEGTTLLLPGSTFADYVWGEPRDEPVQALGTGQWAIRNAVPLTPAGTIRTLDAVETWVNQGRGGQGLTDYLRRAGVSHLLVRNDLDRTEDNTDPVLVHQALAESPGLVRERSFGPLVGGAAALDAGAFGRIVINGGWQTRYPAVEVYRVEGAPVQARTADRVPVVVGGPEDLLDLQDLGVLGEDPTELAVDLYDRAPEDGAPVVLTDGLRDVERGFGRIHDATSAVRDPDDPRRLSNPTGDYLEDGWRAWQTRAGYDGVRLVSASSSLSDATTPGVIQRGALPYAAVDGDPDTAWRSQAATGSAPWWQLDLEGGTAVPRVTVTATEDQPARVRVVTVGGATDEVVVPAGGRRTVEVDDDATDFVRIEESSGGAGAELALAEVTVPGVLATRVLALPTLPDDWPAPARVVLRAVDDVRTGCVTVAGDVRCVPGRAVGAEEPGGFRRSFVLNEDASYTPALRVRLRPGEAARELLLRDGPVDVEASSEGVPDLRASALAAVDGDFGTTWSAEPGDFRPELRLAWLGVRGVAGLRLALDREADARLPNRVEVSWPGGEVEADVNENGKVRFPLVRTDQLTVRVLEADPATSVDFRSASSAVPVGVSELRVQYVPFFPSPFTERRLQLPCGSGPLVVVDGRSHLTAVTVSAQDLYDGRSVPARVCSSTPWRLGAGEHRVDVLASAAFVPASVVLSDGSALASSSPVAQRADGPVERRYDGTDDGTDDSTLLATTENANPGWSATQDGRALESRTVDGWRQGYAVRDAGAPVTAAFDPDRVYRVGLAGGLVLALLTVVLVLLRGRRWPDDAPALGAARLPVAVPPLLALVGGGLLAGTTGAVLGAVAAVLALAVRERAEDLRWLLLALAVLPAVGAYVLRPWGGTTGWAGAMGWPQLLVVSAWGLVVGYSVSRRGADTSRKRWAGLSTRR